MEKRSVASTLLVAGVITSYLAVADSTSAVGDPSTDPGCQAGERISTQILSAPPRKTTRRRSHFTFEGFSCTDPTSLPPTSFDAECILDGVPIDQLCEDPKAIGPLNPGRHVFEVKVDYYFCCGEFSVVDQTPATYAWKIKRRTAR